MIVLCDSKRAAAAAAADTIRQATNVIRLSASRQQRCTLWSWCHYLALLSSCSGGSRSSSSGTMAAAAVVAV
jgi:hypothetical protein